MHRNTLTQYLLHGRIIVFNNISNNIFLEMGMTLTVHANDQNNCQNNDKPIKTGETRALLRLERTMNLLWH